MTTQDKDHLAAPGGQARACSLHPFLVQIKRGSLVQDSFEVMGESQERVEQQHRCLRSPGQSMLVTPLPSEDELIAADLERDAGKGQKLAARNDARAFDLQMVDLDAVRRAGL